MKPALIEKSVHMIVMQLAGKVLFPFIPGNYNTSYFSYSDENTAFPLANLV
jgi:hypothetical protein